MWRGDARRGVLANPMAPRLRADRATPHTAATTMPHHVRPHARPLGVPMHLVGMPHAVVTPGMPGG